MTNGKEDTNIALLKLVTTIEDFKTELLDKLQKTNDKITKTSFSLENTNKELARIITIVERHNDFIEGNGKDGAKIEISALKKFMQKKEHDEEIRNTEKRGFNRKFNLVVAAALISFVFNILLFYFTKGH